MMDDSAISQYHQLVVNSKAVVSVGRPTASLSDAPTEEHFSVESLATINVFTNPLELSHAYHRQDAQKEEMMRDEV